MKNKKIYLNLIESPYEAVIYKFHLFFSSELYLNKFNKLVKNYIYEENEKIKIRYHVNAHLENMFIISLYKKIEKRGFRVIHNNKEYNKIEPSFFIGVDE